MQNIFDFIINKPMGWILEKLGMLTGGNFAASVFLFTLLINLILIPLSVKTQRSTAKQAKLRPKLDLLKQRYGDNKVKYNEEMSKLYQEEKISMTGGCLPMLIRMPFLFGVYYAVTRPLTYLMGMSADLINQAREAYGALNNIAADKLQTITELNIVHDASQLQSSVPQLAEIGDTLNFSFFGLDLTQSPHFTINIFGGFQAIWIIPILSFATAMLTSVVSMRMQKRTNPDAPNMAGMMLTMPLISLFIAFTVPGAVGFYWTCSNLVSGTIQTLLSYIYSPNKIIAMDQAKLALKRKEHEAERMNQLPKKLEAE
ncbi:MAG: YidC/Oxa1 family membrane protein insertase [Clostridiales bacterium]|nr:YidC/Oxa1 family membrane protein insertase [Clostridiales bacterium]